MIFDMALFWDIFLPILFFIILIAVTSFVIIRDLKKAFMKVYKIRSKFDIELRKLVNLMVKLHENSKLQPFTSVVIKKLPHEQKKILLKNLEEEYEKIDKDDKDNAYIVETYNRLQETRRVRDAEILIYNNKLLMFPYNLYARIMKLKKYELYTTKE